MADNIQIEDAGRDVVNVATEDIGGVEVQVVKIGFGPHGTLNKVDDTNKLPVDIGFIGTTPSDIQPISGVVSLDNVVAISASNPIPVVGTFSMSATDLQVDGQKVTTDNALPISGTVFVSNQTGFPIVGISGTPSVSVSNFPSTQTISGTVIVSSLPTTTIGNVVEISASSPIEVNYSGTQPISGSVLVSNPVTTVGVSSIPNITISNPQTVVGISGSPNVVVGNTIGISALNAIPISGSLSSSPTNLQYDDSPITSTHALPVSGTLSISTEGLATSSLQLSANNYLNEINNKFPDVVTQEYLKELTTIMELLAMAVRSMTNNVSMMVDVNGRQRTNVEIGTLTSLTTVSTLTNQTQIGGYAANYQIPSSMNTAINVTRTNIVVS